MIMTINLQGEDIVATISGNTKNVSKAAKLVRDMVDKGMFSSDEGYNRLLLQTALDKARCEMIYNGCSVYSKDRIIHDFKICLNSGMEYMSDELYCFFINSCGTIAHYNRVGWLDWYSNKSKLKELFKRNNYGMSILDYIPDRHTDSKEIVYMMLRLLKIKI